MPHAHPPLRIFVSHPPHGVIFFPFAVIYFHPGAGVLPGGSGCYAPGLQVINFMYGYVSLLNSESVRFVCILYIQIDFACNFLGDRALWPFCAVIFYPFLVFLGRICGNILPFGKYFTVICVLEFKNG